MAKTSSAGVSRKKQLKLITSLELKYGIITDEVLARLNGLKNLRELHVLDASEVTLDGLAYVRKLRRLEWINLDRVSAGNEWLACLLNMKHLSGIQLNNTFASNSGLQLLRSLKNLKYLDLHGAVIDDQSAAIFAKIKSLRTLRLANTRFTDEGVKRLKSLKHLQVLQFTASMVTEETIAQLQNALPDCQINWRRPGKIAPAKLMHGQENPAQFRALQASAAESDKTSWQAPQDSQKAYTVTKFTATRPEWFELLDL